MKTSRRLELRAWLAAGLLLACGAFSAPAQDPGLEAGSEDDFTVKGATGTQADPDFEAHGYSAFGSSAAGATAVTSGAGQVFIQRSLEVGSNLYVRGSGIVFPDNSTQSTAYAASSPVQTLVSGECDTNRTEVLLGTNYQIAAVAVWQNPAVAQSVNVYSNGVLVDTFALTGSSSNRPVAFNLGLMDRLGIACTNTAGTLLFSFQGRRL